MLTSLSIKNYALIESLELTFHRGFSVITGETGAGKSILLGAIGLLVGNRAELSAIREGTSKCVIEGTFDISTYGLKPFFEENELEYDDECIIRRELFAGGKSRAFVNDSPASLTQLKQLGVHLIDIHSQHQNLLLNTESFQLEVLDTLADNLQERENYKNAYNAFRQAEEALRKAVAEQAKNKADEEYIRYQLQQFDNAQLKEGEVESLEEELQMLSHAEEIKTDLYNLDQLLSGEGTGQVRSLQTCVHTLRSLEKNYPKASEWTSRMENIYLELKDMSEDIRDAVETVSFNPQRLEEIESRLDLIYSLQQKFHTQSIDELLQIEADYRKKIESLDKGDENIEELSQILEKGKILLEKEARALSSSRRKAAALVEKNIVGQLRELGMPNIRFEISIASRPAPEQSGMDAVSFRFSANKSSSLQDIADVASGGEISRLMLAIKAILAKARQLPTIIFDEIDTGISGNIANKMGEIMQEMSSDERQIISITHLPQIASKGTTHYLVSKTETSEGTVTSISELSLDERIHEIASMMSGAKLTEAAINNAKVLLGIHS
ncbi:MAG: DNA repair protein RecN [Bacteroidaceae bacterium]|nr:DNA repair protein RecN [Bacteroidaceae bacterium]